MLYASRHRPASELGDAIAAAARRFGAVDGDVYLADYDQRMLRPLRGGGEALAMDGTLGGRAFTHDETLGCPDHRGAGLWVPVVDGAERVGALYLVVTEDTAEMRDWLAAFAGLIAVFIISVSHYSDVFFRLRRGRDMTLAAEMQWSSVPPLTYTTDELTFTALLEPAYEVAGDTFDYAHNHPTLHVAVFDAMGHGLNSTMTATLAVGAYRHARRRGADLVEISRAIDDELSAHRPDGFATAMLLTLECETSRLTWLSAGHPAPMLIRDRRIQRLHATPGLPLGLAAGFNAAAPTVSATTLQPGDRVVVFSDGCTEATTPDGERFGEERLGEFVIRQQAAGLSPAETLRRLSHAVIDHAGGKIDDDATIALLEFRGRNA